MNQPPVNEQSKLAGLVWQIDRLVDGELGESDRRALLRRFETEPDGWRCCALAFLEAQSWREALVPLAAAAATQPYAPAARGRFRSSRWRSAVRVSGLAASLLLTFALGWSLHSNPIANSRDNSIAQSGEASPAKVSETQEPDVAVEATADPLPEERFGPMTPVIKKWEQQGYQAETQTRLASLKMKDGRKVEVPVHEVRLRYIRDRTY